MGGPVAFWLAMEHPEAVTHFVFIESGLPGFGLEQFMDVAKGGSWHFGFFMAPEYPEMLTAGKEREFFKSFAYGIPPISRMRSANRTSMSICATIRRPEECPPGLVTDRLRPCRRNPMAR